MSNMGLRKIIYIFHMSISEDLQGTIYQWYYTVVPVYCSWETFSAYLANHKHFPVIRGEKKSFRFENLLYVSSCKRT